MTSLFVPVITFVVKIQNNLRDMSARIGKVKAEIALHDDSFDGSEIEDAQYIGLMKDEHSESFANGVTYKLIPVAATGDTASNMQNSPSHDTYFVSLGNPVEVFSTNTAALKSDREKKPKVQTVSQQAKVISTKKRDDKRRATHNEVERRRRDKINTWIMKLATLIPNSAMPDSASKGGILAKACDYITELHEKQKRLDKLEVENEKLVLEVLRLNQELTDLRKENTSVRNQLADNCIVFPHRPKEEKS